MIPMMAGLVLLLTLRCSRFILVVRYSPTLHVTEAQSFQDFAFKKTLIIFTKVAKFLKSAVCRRD